MAKRKGRDWSEWKEHYTGMHRLDKGFRQQHSGTRLHRLQTETSISLRDLDIEKDHEEPRLWVWALVFIGMLLIRKGYIEYSRYEKAHSSHTEISRTK